MKDYNENSAQIVLLFAHSSEYLATWIVDESKMQDAIQALAPEEPHVWAFYAVRATAFGSKSAIRRIAEAEVWPRGAAVFIDNAKFFKGRLIDPQGIDSVIWSIDDAALSKLVAEFCSEYNCVDFSKMKK